MFADKIGKQGAASPRRARLVAHVFFLDLTIGDFGVWRRDTPALDESTGAHRRASTVCNSRFCSETRFKASSLQKFALSL
jgi:hypothetical protein